MISSLLQCQSCFFDPLKKIEVIWDNAAQASLERPAPVNPILGSLSEIISYEDTKLQ